MVKTSPESNTQPRRLRIIGVVCAGFGLLIGVASIWQSLDAGDVRGAGLAVVALAMVLVGAAIVSRTGQRIGWITATSGALILVPGLGGPLESLGFGPWLYSIGLLLFLFPDGRPVSRRWNWILWTASVALLLSLIVELFAPGGWSDQGALLLIVFAFIPVAMVSLIVRYVRSTGVERLQLRWFVFAGLVLVVIDLAWEQLASIVPLPDAFWDVTLAVALLGLPAAIGVAVLRYKLYEIDRIVSRTVSYALVVATLGLLYFGMVTLAAQFLPTQNALAVAGATLAIAALFNPLRRRVQRAVDSRFNRSGFRVQTLSEQFGLLLREARTSDQLVSAWTATVANALQPTAIGVWLNPALAAPPREES